MAQKSSTPFKLFKRLALLANGTINVETLSGNKTLTLKDAQIQKLDPAAASRDVTLPAEEESEGAMFLIINAADAAESVVVKNDAAATIATLTADGTASERVLVVCDGSDWISLGVTALNSLS